MKTYISEKKQTLYELGISLTSEQLSHLKELKSKIAVDNFARKLILSDGESPRGVSYSYMGLGSLSMTQRI